MERIIFRDANLLDGRNPAVAGRSVVVEGNRIRSVEPDEAVEAGPNDRIVELSGATLMPGMVQAHWHGSYEGLDFAPPPVGLEKPPGYLMLLAAHHARLALERGFTSVIGAATGDALDAQLKMAIADGVVEGPRITACGRWLITTGDSNDLPAYWWWEIGAMGSQRFCDGADEFRKGVRREIHEGADVVKIFMDGGHALQHGSDFISMADEELHAAVEAAHHRGKLVRCHVTSANGIRKCIEAGVDIFDHADRMDVECIESLARAGSFVCPSLYFTKAIVERLGKSPRGRAAADGLRADYDHMLSMLPRAVEAGVKLMVGDDWGTSMTPHGDYIKEFELYVDEAGIDPLEVLRWATTNPSLCNGPDADLGTVESGKLADLIVVRGDPSQEISLLGDPENILVVMKDGKLVKENFDEQGF
jgi:imidazolonepropionase-like amidohydrolase